MFLQIYLFGVLIAGIIGYITYRNRKAQFDALPFSNDTMAQISVLIAAIGSWLSVIIFAGYKLYSIVMKLRNK